MPAGMMCGAEAFELMDSYGMPLDTLVDLWREKGMAFDVVEFARAAIESGNFSPTKIEERLKLCAPPAVPQRLIELAVLRAQGLV